MILYVQDEAGSGKITAQNTLNQTALIDQSPVFSTRNFSLIDFHVHSVPVPSLDEVATFLLYVKSLEHHQRPDYQLLKDVLASGGRGKLDFSRTEGPAAKSNPEPVDPPSRDKVRSRLCQEVQCQSFHLVIMLH